MTSHDFSIKLNKPDEENKSHSKNELSFEIQGDNIYGLDKSVINGIRRTLLTDINTCAFNENNIMININKSSLHNEFLKQRISLIPLYINPDDYEYLLFKLKVKCDVSIKNVTVDMFDIYRVNADTNHQLKIQQNMDYLSDEDNIREKLKTLDTTYYDMDKPLNESDKKEIFRPIEFEGITSYFLLTELKQLNSEKEFEEIELYCIPDINTGRHHARYNNLSTVVYTFKKNNELFDSVLASKIKLNKIKNVEEYSKHLKISESERYYYRDINNEPYWYNFKILSNHFYDSEHLFIQSMDILLTKFELMKNKISYIQDESMETDFTLNLYKNELCYKLNMPEEDDTTGNMIQCHTVNKFIDDSSFIQFCGYKKPHPLKNEIFMTIMIKPNEYSNPQRINFIIKFLVDVIEDLINLLDRFKTMFIKDIKNL